MADRLQAARDRVRQALLAGEDTRPFRDALAAAESAEAARSERADAIHAEAQKAAQARVAVRAAELASGCRGRIDTLLARHPVPVFRRETVVEEVSNEL